jgi:hypothetical protein
MARDSLVKLLKTPPPPHLISEHMAAPDGAAVFGGAAAARALGPLSMLFAGAEEKRELVASVIEDVVRGGKAAGLVDQPTAERTLTGPHSHAANPPADPS